MSFILSACVTPTHTLSSGRILARLVNHLPFRTLVADISAEDAIRLDELAIAATVLHPPGSISVPFDFGDAIIGDVIMGGYAGGAIRPSQPNFHYFAADLPGAMASRGAVVTAVLDCFGLLFPSAIT